MIKKIFYCYLKDNYFEFDPPWLFTSLEFSWNWKTDIYFWQADKSYIIPHPIGFNKQTGLYTSKSELFMTLGQVHFTEEGKLNVRCEATIGNEKNLTDSSIKQKKR